MRHRKAAHNSSRIDERIRACIPVSIGVWKFPDADPIKDNENDLSRLQRVDSQVVCLRTLAQATR
jgi:hypothetical protein